MNRPGFTEAVAGLAHDAVAVVAIRSERGSYNARWETSRRDRIAGVHFHAR